MRQRNEEVTKNDYGYADTSGQKQKKAEDRNQANNAEDLINYKGIYFNDDQGNKFTDPVTGAHFEFKDMCKRIIRIQ